MKPNYFLVTGLMLFVCVSVMTQQVDAQKVSRAEAIARIAELYPNSDKSAEQIYDEGQITQASRAFARRFGNWQLSALTGALEEDSIQVVPVRVVARTPDPTYTTGDSTQQGNSTVETRQVKRHSVFYSKHKIITTVKQDFSQQDRRKLRKDFLKIYENLPRDVRILLKPYEKLSR